MSSTFEKLTSNKVKLNFVVSAEDFDKALATAYSKNVKRFNIPGFRRGKAPRHVIEMHYGPSVFFEDAFDEIFPVVYSEAIKEHSVEPVDRPELNMEQIEKGKDLIFSVEVFVTPDVELGQYKNLGIEKKVDEVTEDDVKAEIERHGLKLFGVLPQDDAVYRCDCNGEPSAKLPEDDVMKTALKEVLKNIGL